MHRWRTRSTLWRCLVYLLFLEVFKDGTSATRDTKNDIKAATSATPRVIPADGEPEQGTCIRCGQPSAYGKRLIFGRAY